MSARGLSLFALRALLWGLTALGALALVLMLSERATAVAARALSAAVPGLLLEHRSGNLLEARFARIGWQGSGTAVLADDVAWTLAPQCLLRDRLCFASLSLARLDIVLGPQDEAAAEPFALEPVLAPLPLTITHGAIEVLGVRRGNEELFALDGVRIAGSFVDSRIRLERLTARMDEFAADLRADIELRAQLPLAIEGRIDWARRERIELRLEGDLAHLGFRLGGSGEYAIDAEGFAELLADAPRIELSASSREALYPLARDPAAAALHEVRLRVSGSSEELQAQFAARIEGTLLGGGGLEGAASWSPGQARISRLELSGDAGRLVLDAELAGDRWQANARADDFCPLAWRPGLDCRLSGEATADGTVAGAASTVALRTALAGRVNGREARIDASAERAGDGAWRIPALEVANGANRLRASGNVGATLAIDATLELGDLGDTLAGAGGSGRATLRLAGTPSDPKIDGELQARGLRWRDYRAEALALQARWAGLEQTANRVHLEASAVVAGGVAIGALGASLDGSRAAHRLALEARSDTARLAAQCAGALGEGGDWRGDCDTLALQPHPASGEWRADRRLALAWDGAGRALQVGAFCLRQADAQLCSNRSALLAADRLGGIALSGRGIPLTVLAPWLPAGVEADGLLSMEASASRGAREPPRFEARVTMGAGTLHVPVAGEPLALELNGVALGLQGTGDAARLSWQLALQGGAGVAGEAGLDFGARTIDGTLQLQALELTRFAALLPGMLEAGGTLGGELRVQGALDAPQVRGMLELADGRFAHERLPQPIENAGITVAFADSKARIDGQLRTGAGTATLGGDARFDDDGWSAELTLDSAALQIEPLRGSTATVAPRLRVQLGPALALLSGEVVVPHADIRLDELPETAAGESPWAVVVGEQAPPTPFAYGLEVRVSLGERVRLRGLGVDARLEGALDVTRDPADALLRGRGEIRIAEGRYAAYGQSLEVTEGRIRFRGALDRPDLRLTAIRRIEDEDVQVGVRVRGELQDPVVSVFSRPGMEETLAMHYLLTGRKPEAGGNADLAVSGMLMQMGLAGANRITADAASRFGIQDFRVGARQVEGGTEVQLSGYLSPDLYLRYGRSTFDGINTFRLRYRLRGSFYVEAISGIENAIDFLYSFDR